MHRAVIDAHATRFIGPRQRVLQPLAVVTVLEVLARVRASFRLRLGCAVVADAGEGAGEAAAGEGNGEGEGAQTAPTARPQPPALSLGPLLVAVGSAVSVDVSGLDAWQE